MPYIPATLEVPAGGLMNTRIAKAQCFTGRLRFLLSGSGGFCSRNGKQLALDNYLTRLLPIRTRSPVITRGAEASQFVIEQGLNVIGRNVHAGCNSKSIPLKNAGCAPEGMICLR